MDATDLPTRFQIPFGNVAAAGFIRNVPEASQIGIQAGAASLTDGFPPDCFDPVGAGGTPPFGQDFNGLLKQITQWCRWQAAGGPVPYNASFASSIGGYPAGAILASATIVGYFWISTIDANVSNPDSGGANWISFSVFGGTFGDMKFRPTDEDLLSAGWIKANSLTIGNAASNAAQLASAIAGPVFGWHWSNFSNTQCPVFTSAGVPTTRGVSGPADFAANKRIQTLDWRGVGPKGLDTMGAPAAGLFTGVPFVFGSSTQWGSIAGANTHALILAELAAHSHGINDPTHNHGLTDPTHRHQQAGALDSQTVTGGATSMTTGVGSGNNTAFAATGISVLNSGTNITIQNAGSSSAHNNVERNMLGTWYIKL